MHKDQYLKVGELTGYAIGDFTGYAIGELTGYILLTSNTNN